MLSAIPRHHATRAPVIVAVSLLVLACDQPSGLKHGPPTSEVVLSGQDQVGVVGHELALPVSVQVKDGWTTPISDWPVVLTNGGGSVSDFVVRTSADGVATTK